MKRPPLAAILSRSNGQSIYSTGQNPIRPFSLTVLWRKTFGFGCVFQWQLLLPSPIQRRHPLRVHQHSNHLFLTAGAKVTLPEPESKV